MWTFDTRARKKMIKTKTKKKRAFVCLFQASLLR